MLCELLHLEGLVAHTLSYNRSRYRAAFREGRHCYAESNVACTRYLLILFREAPAEVWAMTRTPQMVRRGRAWDHSLCTLRLPA